MQDDSGEDCVGGAGGASQGGISVLDELCMGSQVYDATAHVFMMTEAVALCSWRTWDISSQWRAQVPIIWQTLRGPQPDSTSS